MVYEPAGLFFKPTFSKVFSTGEKPMFTGTFTCGSIMSCGDAKDSRVR